MLYTMNYILHIKNLVCPHCIKTVERILAQNKCVIKKIEWEKAAFHCTSRNLNLEMVSKELNDSGFKLLFDTKEIVAEQIKLFFIHQIYLDDKVLVLDDVQYILSANQHRNYKKLDALFKYINGYSIFMYIEKLRFERAKELVSYQELSIDTIAKKLGYSCLSDLKKCFIKVLHRSMDEFLKAPHRYRISLDQI